MGLVSSVKGMFNKKPPEARGSAAKATTTAANASAHAAATREQAVQLLKPEPINSLGYQMIWEDSKNADIQSILSRYAIAPKTDSTAKAALSKDGNTLMITLSGSDALKQHCGGAGMISRGAYKCYGWLTRTFGSPHKSDFVAAYDKAYQGSAVKEQGEDVGSLMKAFGRDEYSLVITYKKDENGQFTKAPAAFAVIDSYKHLIEPNVTRDLSEQKASPEQIKSTIEQFTSSLGNYQVLDKVIPVAEHVLPNAELMRNITEALFAMNKDLGGLVVPQSLTGKKFSQAGGLVFNELPWQKICQTGESKWAIKGDKAAGEKLLNDKNAPDDLKKVYTDNVINENVVHTIVRPESKAQTPLPTLLGFAQAWSNLSQGSELRSSDPATIKFINVANTMNDITISELNKELVPSKPDNGPILQDSGAKATQQAASN